MSVDITRAAALIAVLGAAVVYGTDMFCAMVLRPALALADDGALVAVTGRVHRYGDRRMPVPGVLGVVATAASAVLATVAAHWAQAIAAGAALALLLKQSGIASSAPARYCRVWRWPPCAWCW